MGLILLLIFVVLPLAEIYVLIQVGDSIGALTTIFLVILTAVIGSVIIKYQGVRVWMRLQQELRSGHPPAVALWHALLLAVAGVCLITPGFLTDSVGFLLLFPPLRLWLLRTIIQRWLQKRFSNKVKIIDGEYKIVD